MRISIAGKVCFVLLLIFSSVLIGTTSHQAYRERQMAMLMHGTQAQQLLHAYIEGLDNLPAGTISQAHQALRQRILHHPLMLDLQLLPLQTAASSIPNVSSPPTQQLIERGKETILVVEKPWLVDSRLLMKSCPKCQPLPPGKTLVRVRLDYALTPALARIETDLLTTALLLSLFFGAGLLLALYIIRRQIVGPLQRISLAMERATDLGDRTIRLPVERNDELGRLSENFNHLMESLTAETSPSSSPPPQP
ncbi:MAG: HAMP domain-containing protein [Aeromonadaceae bacterium]|nr:HAMP domain-containing protein [Aeromonadaceae bacterium]MBP9568910.1 HAMP domain-containing protein [Aeromonadaceae bacterium]